jgi:hypothetical protein
MEKARGQRADIRVDGLKDGPLRNLDCSIGPGHFERQAAE